MAKAATAEEIKETFLLWDEEGDGKIDAADAGTVIRALNHKPSQAQLKKIINKEYAKNEKRMTFEEWKPFYDAVVNEKEKNEGTKAEFCEGLKLFDKEQQGKVYSVELRHILAGIGERLALDDVDEVIADMADADDMIKIEDFAQKIVSGPNMGPPPE